MKKDVKWLQTPEDHDFPAAASYLSLLYYEKTVAEFIKKLKEAPIVQFKAKDVLRASGYSPLGIDNAHVRKDMKKIEDGEELSPILIVRIPNEGRMIIADGWHRTAAVYAYQEDAEVKCKII